MTLARPQGSSRLLTSPVAYVSHAALYGLHTCFARLSAASQPNLEGVDTSPCGIFLSGNQIGQQPAAAMEWLVPLAAKPGSYLTSRALPGSRIIGDRVSVIQSWADQTLPLYPVWPVAAGAVFAKAFVSASLISAPAR